MILIHGMIRNFQFKVKLSKINITPKNMEIWSIIVGANVVEEKLNLRIWNIEMSGPIGCNCTARILQDSTKLKGLSLENKQKNNSNNNCNSNENNRMCISYITEMDYLKKT